MARSIRHDKFLQLRADFPFFIFEKQEYKLSPAGLDIRFTFNLGGQYFFHPTIFIPRKSFFLPDVQLEGRLDSFVFSIGMTELVSYWKSACPPRVIIRPFALRPEQVAWWKKLYFHGLGEFFYLNSIDTDEEGFMELEAAEGPFLPEQRFALDEAVIVPVGGGKDSAVTLELIGSARGCLPLIMNPRGASLKTVAASGSDPNGIIEVRRTIDPQLLQLNDLGFLNGHTPFSALLAFITALAAILSGHRHIALSNESSASEATVGGTLINHQYSKSFGFETDFRWYMNRWISRDINYFSFLRPLGELQIAYLFSRFRAYHPVFKSCNAGSRTDTWCCSCAKCLFTWIMLSPFLSEEVLLDIFGRNLFADESLLPLLQQLTGIAEEKPFDCVGTVSEVNLALCETIRQWDLDDLPVLLKHYCDSPAYSLYKNVDFASALSVFSPQHHLRPEFEQILADGLKGGDHD
jgi:hypothetical protein